jgi:hypothetical protein
MQTACPPPLTRQFHSDHPVAHLAACGSALGRYLQSVAHRPLGEHLDALMRAGTPNPSPSFRLCLETLYRHLSQKAGCDAQRCCDGLRALPVIQQADHANLLLDRETLLNNLLFALAARRAGARTVVTIQCSSVSSIARRRPYRGPPFLYTRNGCYDVFGCSARTYARAAFSELAGPVTANFVPSPTSTPLDRDALIGALHGRTWAGPLECFEAINAKLWGALGGGQMPTLTILDDRFSYDLVATHLEAKDSPLYRLVFDPAITSVCTEIRQALSSLPSARGVSTTEPAYFWARSGRRFEPVVTTPSGDGTLSVIPVLCARRAFSVDASELPRLVRARALIPSKMLIYFARCLLPGIRAIGGTSQQDYLAHYRTLLLELQTHTRLLDADDLLNVRRGDLNQLGGAPLLEPDSNLAETLAFAQENTDWDGAFERFLSKPLCETVGALSCAGYLVEKFRNRGDD